MTYWLCSKKFKSGYLKRDVIKIHDEAQKEGFVWGFSAGFAACAIVIFVAFNIWRIL